MALSYCIFILHFYLNIVRRNYCPLSNTRTPEPSQSFVLLQLWLIQELLLVYSMSFGKSNIFPPKIILHSL